MDATLLRSRLPAALASAPQRRADGDGGSPGMTAPRAAGAAATGAAAPGLDGAVPLTTLPKGATGRVAGVRLTGAAAHDPASERVALRLIEIGFVEGEALQVVAFGQPGDDPIGVRIGGRGGRSTFALRRLEAACVWVVPDATAPSPAGNAA